LKTLSKKTNAGKLGRRRIQTILTYLAALKEKTIVKFVPTSSQRHFNVHISSPAQCKRRGLKTSDS